MTTPNAPSILVEPGAHAASGETATLVVHVRNLAAEPNDVHVSLIGLEATWAPETFVVPGVGADETVTVTVPVRPVAGAAPGEYPCIVAVETRGPAGAARTLADAAVRVDGESELVLSVEPVEARAVRSAAVDVVLVNASDLAADVHLDAAGRDGVVVDVPREPVHVAARQTVRVGARVRSPRVRLLGHRHRYSYAVTATGRAAPLHVQANLSVRPLVSSAFARAVAIVAVVAVWLAGVVVALPQLAERFTDRSTSVEHVAVEVEDTDGDPGAAGGDPAADSDADGPGAEDDAADDGAGPGPDRAPGVRAAGQVTGPDPGGATISIVPAASLWDPTTDDDAGSAPDAAAPLERAADMLVALHPVLPAARGLARIAVGPRDAPPGAGKIFAGALPLQPSDGSTQRMTVRSDAEGSWAIAGLSETDRYLVSIAKPGYQTQRVLRTGAELAATPLETEMRPGTGRLAGNVTGPDGPAGGVEITISDGTTTVTTRTATRDGVGRWQVDGLATPGTYLVTASSDRLGARSRLVTLPASGVRAVDLRLRPGIAGITGRVVGKDSLGGTGGVGGLTITASNGTDSRSATTATGDSGQAGSFVLPDLPVPATYTVTVEGPGYNTVTRQVRLGPAGRTGWDVSVGTQGGTVTGSVVARGGDGITGVGLTLTAEGEIFKTMSGSDGRGTFLFSGIPAGTYVLSAEAFGFESTHAQVTVRDGRGTTVGLRLAPVPDDGLTSTGSITGRVTDASHGGVVTCVELFDDDECLVHARIDFKRLDGTPARIETWTDPESSYRLPDVDPATGAGLPPGRYTVHLSAPGYEPSSVQVTVGMGVTAEAATVALIPSPSLIGTVIPRAGTLASDTCVVVHVPGADPVAGVADPCATHQDECNSATSRCVQVASGGYTIDRLRAGTYEVRLANLDPRYRQPAPVQVVLTPGDVRRYDFTVERLGIINLTVLEAGDSGSVTSVDNATVRATNLTADAPVRTATTSNGFVSFGELEPGTWELAVVDGSGTSAIAMTHVGVDLNQEVAAQIVIASAVQTFTVAVGWEQVDGQTTPLEGATVRVRGVTRYIGTIPSRDTVTFTTNANGIAVVCTVEDDCEGAEVPIELVDRIVDVTIEMPGFQTVVWNSVPFTEIQSVQLQPDRVPFEGRIFLEPAPSAGANNPYGGVTFEIEQAPPGVGRISLSVQPGSGEVMISDSAGAGGNRIRPGTWQVRAVRSGFNSETVTFTVPPGAPSFETSWTLEQHGRLVVRARHGSTAIPGARIVLRDGVSDIATRTTGADGQADFGTLPPSSNDPDAPVSYSLEVRAAGFAPVSGRDVEIRAGRTANEVELVTMTQLGSISGRTRTKITDTWFETLGGATVHVEHDEDGDAFTALSQSNGDYRVTGEIDLPGLQDGDWHVTASADGHHDGTFRDADGDPSTVTLGPGQQRTGVGVDLEPQDSELTVTVYDGEDLVEGLTVLLRWNDDGETRLVEPCEDVAACVGLGPGEYRFTGLKPITYTINVTGQGTQFNAVTVQHKVGLASFENLPVAISAPAGSVQGMLYQRTTAGGLDILPGHPVMLVPVDVAGDARPGTSSSTGRFTFPDVPAGEYALEAYAPGTDPQDPDATWIVRREITVTTGQSAVVDLVVERALVATEVQVTSSNETDLSGAQVVLDGVLEGGETARFGPVPLMRSSPAGHGYTATFPQLPVGDWTPTVSGPAGHFGEHVGAQHTVTAGGPSVITLAVAEREIRMRATSLPGMAPPATPVTLEVGPDEFIVNRSVQVGAGDVIVFVPSSPVALTAQAPAGWGAHVTPPGTRPAGSSTVTFEVALVPNLSLAFCGSTSVMLLTDFECHVQLGGPPGLGLGGLPVSLTAGAWSTTVTTDAAGRAGFTVPAATVAMTDFVVGASVELAGVEVADGVHAVTVQGTTSFAISMCSANAVANTAYPCPMTLTGVGGYSSGNRQVLVELVRGSGQGEDVAWSATVQTAANGTVTVTVPASAVGTTNFRLRATWQIPGRPQGAVVATTNVTVPNPGGGPGGPGGGGPGGGGDDGDGGDG